jgi:glycerophosphoryl diester phosphodiesterase
MPVDFKWIATFAHGVGVNSEIVMYWPEMTNMKAFVANSDSALVTHCHSLGLKVFAYKCAVDDVEYLPQFKAPHLETQLYYRKKLDGVFSEQVAT